MQHALQKIVHHWQCPGTLQQCAEYVGPTTTASVCGWQPHAIKRLQCNIHQLELNGGMIVLLHLNPVCLVCRACSAGLHILSAIVSARFLATAAYDTQDVAVTCDVRMLELPQHRHEPGGVWFGFVRFAMPLAVVLCRVDRCFGSWALLGSFWPFRLTPS